MGLLTDYHQTIPFQPLINLLGLFHRSRVSPKQTHQPHPLATSPSTNQGTSSHIKALPQTGHYTILIWDGGTFRVSFPKDVESVSRIKICLCVVCDKTGTFYLSEFLLVELF
ncbi:hypothetical protein TNCV_2379401 [Trichonephila clavipes]|uniref:Uncharacterized protein n=1 Tax=Trichonephila clavipes TaxID=2585209 RepID=A0A8X6RLI4_TRICX|nr:hypothetical protein TNCV_2379401 [Trichonephila clavipes]